MNHESSYAGKPIRSLQTMLYTISHVEPELEAPIPDGVYGQETVHSVSVFQRMHNLPCTGITDQETWNEIVKSYALAEDELSGTADLEIIMPSGSRIESGSNHPCVPIVQGILGLLHQQFHCLHAPDPSGVLDDTTQIALKDFQALCSLPVHGCIDKATWKHLAMHYPIAAAQCQKPHTE